MELRTWRSQKLRTLFLLMTLGLMAMIFAFSAQNGDRSHEVSGALIAPVLDVVVPGWQQMPASVLAPLRQAAEYIIRKIGHFSEYAALGFALRLLLQTFATRHRSSKSWLAVALYAATDELHQLFVSSRSAMWQDVVLDSIGGLAGIAAAYALVVLLQRHWVKKERERHADDSRTV